MTFTENSSARASNCHPADGQLCGEDGAVFESNYIRAVTVTWRGHGVIAEDRIVCCI